MRYVEFIAFCFVVFCGYEMFFGSAAKRKWGNLNKTNWNMFLGVCKYKLLEQL